MREINAIVIHYSASGDVPASTIDRWHRDRGFSEIGYHVVVRRSGLREIGRLDLKPGAHTRWHNKHTLGVVLTGADTLPWYPAEAQQQALARQIQIWQYAYGRTMKIYFHRELNRTPCPGRLSKERVLELVGAIQPRLPLFRPLPKPARQPTRTYPLLKRGSTGGYVVICQQRLNIHRVGITVDGAFGPKTEAGVKAFQSARSIRRDGIVGPVTWKWLLSPPGRG